MFKNEGIQQRRACAVTKPIPIAYFNANEKEIRQLGINKYGYQTLKAIYRGPRCNKNSSMTRREDATHVRLYMK